MDIAVDELHNFEFVSKYQSLDVACSQFLGQMSGLGRGQRVKKQTAKAAASSNPAAEKKETKAREIKVESKRHAPPAPSAPSTAAEGDIKTFLQAAASGDSATCGRMIESGANIGAVDEHGRSALILASRGGFTQVISLLHRAKVNKHLRDRKGYTCVKLFVADICVQQLNYVLCAVRTCTLS